MLPDQTELPCGRASSAGAAASASASRARRARRRSWPSRCGTAALLRLAQALLQHVAEVALGARRRRLLHLEGPALALRRDQLLHALAILVDELRGVVGSVERRHELLREL